MPFILLTILVHAITILVKRTKHRLDVPTMLQYLDEIWNSSFLSFWWSIWVI